VPLHRLSIAGNARARLSEPKPRIAETLDQLSAKFALE
jgi:hypothetical protein